MVVSDFDRLKELAQLFLRLGFTAFGGPAAHIAMMEDEVVRRRKWLTQEEFLDLVGAVNLIPGPNSTELAIHIGHRRHGWGGLLLAGCCFIVPAMLIVLAIAWAYVRFGQLPQVESLLYGIKPVMIAVVAQAIWRLGRTALKSGFLAALSVASILLVIFGMNEILVLLLVGAVATIASSFERSRKQAVLSLTAPLFSAVTANIPNIGVAAGAKAFGMLPMFLFFLKIGSILFGSGYVLLAFLRADLVERWHWLSEGQLLDAIAVGQVTPGPVFTTATFIGYLLAGVPGGLVATVGIFLPSFIFVALSGPLVPRIRSSPPAGAFLDGVNVASLSLMALVTLQLARAALVDPLAIMITVVSAWLLFRYRLNSPWLILGGGFVGIVKSII